MEKLKPVTYGNNTSKTHINASETMVLSSQAQTILDTMDEEVKNIVKSCLTDSDRLLEFVKEHGTPVYRFSFADKILSFVNEEEGFVTPLKGLKALYLNFMTGLLGEKKFNISMNSPAMFVLRNLNVDIYYMLHQFHLWYAFKKNLPGFDEESQELFKENLNSMSDSDVKEMSIDEILALKDAIARDTQAAEFVIQLAKESSGAKKALEKMKKDGGAQI